MLRATLDACVLYPAPVRDLLLYLAAGGLYKPFWTDEINHEWVRNLLLKRRDLKEKSLHAAVAAMNAAFPDANISDYSDLISMLYLADKNDRHVLAAAIKSESDFLVTWNVKDFRYDELGRFSLEVQTPDYFISRLIEMNREAAYKAFIAQVNNLKNPPMAPSQVLQTLNKNGLKKAVAELCKII